MREAFSLLDQGSQRSGTQLQSKLHPQSELMANSVEVTLKAEGLSESRY